MKSPRVLIVGAGGFGREVYAWASHVAGQQGWELGGFLDDDPDALQRVSHPARVVASVREYRPGPDDLLLCGIGQPILKRRLMTTLLGRGASFATLVHPTAVLGNDVRIGRGVVICPRVVITTNVTIGDFVVLNVSSCVGHDAVIDNYSTISACCDVMGGARVDEVVFLGSHVALLPGKRVGAAAIVGAGSVVIQPVRPSTTVFGNPAREIQLES